MELSHDVSLELKNSNYVHTIFIFGFIIFLGELFMFISFNWLYCRNHHAFIKVHWCDIKFVLKTKVLREKQKMNCFWCFNSHSGQDSQWGTSEPWNVSDEATRLIANMSAFWMALYYYPGITILERYMFIFCQNPGPSLEVLTNTFFHIVIVVSTWLHRKRTQWIKWNIQSEAKRHLQKSNVSHSLNICSCIWFYKRMKSQAATDT